MTNESYRSKRRCLLSSLQGLSPIVMIAEYRKPTNKYFTVINKSNEETHR